MKRPFLTLAMLTGLGSGCATDADDGILRGGWGGRGLAITATAAGVRVEMPCDNTGDIAAPVLLESDGSFEFETTMRSFYGDFDVYLEGKVSGARLLVELSTEYSRPPAEKYTLYNEIAANFRGYVCLGANP